MVSQTNEAALETHIETTLAKDGYRIGSPADFDREFAVDGKLFWQFLEATQSKELAKLKDRPNWQRLLLERLSKRIKKDSVLAVLKKGLDIDDAHFDLLYRLPYNDLNPEVVANFSANIFSVTRQVHYSDSDTFKSVDMVLFVNGLAIATLELKNPWTGQNVHNAIKQYRTDRDPCEPLFEFGRCLVHFAVDPDEAYMCAQLAGNDSNFLPFNKGFNNGRGNPVNPTGHKTAYLWEDILPRHSLTNIIEQFAKFTVEKDKKTGKERKALFFPRYHQLDVVRGILADAKRYGVGQTYLIQHSAGSGKSNSITWLAYQLVELYDNAGFRNVFDSVVVVTDRRVLDTQLKDNIKLFSETKNIVAHAESAAELKAHLELGKKIIITTVQKFPFIVDGIGDLTSRNFAVIIDEAHSSQSGSASDTLNTTLGAEDEEVPEDIQDKILAAMKGRKMSKNASYFAFTATPKPATLEKFGRQGPDGKFYPFHLYSMKQAIEEKFILDVLEKYTTYKSYYEVQKSVEENPLFDTAKAQKKLKAFVEASPRTIEVKARIMVDHFMSSVWQAKKLKGKAKAMVVTRNIECAIRYFFAIRTALQEANAPFKALVAFSGEKTVDGIKYTEDGLNGIAARDLPEAFEKDDYKILVVANKYLTGFDEPMLHTMYVDKKLQGVLAVQALSRLNRCNWKLGKTDTFVLDFYNSVDDIKKAFDDFYTATTLSEPTDVNVLHDLKDVLDDFGIYDWSEVTLFNDKFFASAEAEELHPIIDVVVARFEADLDDEQRIDFKIKAKQFVKIYAQVAAIIPFNNVSWEMLHWFLKFLIPKLKVKDPDQDKLDELLNSVDLSTYGLERSRLEIKIGLDASETELEPQNPNIRGGHFGEGDKDPLDEIVRTFNERHFAGWEATPEEQRVKFINIAKHVMNHVDYKIQVEDNPDSQNRQLALERLIQQAISVERRRELDLYKRYASDPDFKRAFDASIFRMLSSKDIGSQLGMGSM
ncbi:TPA: type I restriction endonuclease subunit R [Pseudomonas aeruginosa]|uniref:type I restriction endonuclease subunit R n=1 Tax=Pseudomonas aeruginosa TaxID=287 RepID=UPI0007446620|nr:type I restriction endonuclease [Pseudomonas aeruginosa]ALY60535.1 DEAD/DEAH box helicase [Pseudomonas aeruginosa]MCS7782468.1 type I restriction endonuclease [Pseudomonas aeruginosa]OKS26411.1 DEAD/DEAH box helicase [Pseudomonas aeruginosa]RPZ79227.1 type I restriction endonuclease subunit R [Pseudomonas aeruginosa]RUH19595.1 type I restriction endonuclease subunit R [Pseudomonas aeruginosa]